MVFFLAAQALVGVKFCPDTQRKDTLMQPVPCLFILIFGFKLFGPFE